MTFAGFLGFLQVVVGLVTVVALVLAIVQYRRQLQAALDDRVNEIAAVGLTYKVEKPRGSEGGFARYGYDFTIHNPGRLPICDVKVVVRFADKVQRVNSSGTPGRFELNTDLTMVVAAVAAGGSYTWDRHLSVPETLTSRMNETTARILFFAADAGPCKTLWPRPNGKISEALQRRLPPNLKTTEAELRGS